MRLFQRQQHSESATHIFGRRRWPGRSIAVDASEHGAAHAAHTCAHGVGKYPMYTSICGTCHRVYMWHAVRTSGTSVQGQFRAARPTATCQRHQRVHPPARTPARTHGRMFACMYTLMDACTQAHVHARIHAHTHTRTHVRTHACMHAHIHAHVHACMHTYTHACMHACTHTRTRACVQGGVAYC